MTAPHPGLAEYLAVLDKVDQKFAEIQARHPEQFRCGLGCHACCAPGLTVSRVERDRLAAYVRDLPGLAAELEALAHEDPHAGTRCNFLDREGKCLVYLARPVVCRSHGAPVRVTLEGTARLDVCPLNFTGVALERLDAGDRIDVETLNTLLYVVNRRYDATDRGERFALSVAGLRDPA